MRMLATEARVNMSDLRVDRIKDNDWPRLIDKASKLGEANLYIDDTSGISPNEIRSKARRLKQQHGLDMILVDYLQIMKLRQRIEKQLNKVELSNRFSKTLSFGNGFEFNTSAIEEMEWGDCSSSLCWTRRIRIPG